MLTKNLSYYEYCFINLVVNRHNGQVAPHKPLLLISLIDLITDGSITSPIIELSDALVDDFERNANIYVSGTEHFKPNLGMPFFYMRSEPFWKLMSRVDGVTPVVNTISSLRRHYSHAKIDDELFQLLQDSAAAQSLRQVLIETYLTK